jgi:hypothetical protein
MKEEYVLCECCEEEILEEESFPAFNGSAVYCEDCANELKDCCLMDYPGQK